MAKNKKSNTELALGGWFPPNETPNMPFPEIPDDCAVYDASKPKRKALAEQVLQMLKKAGYDAYLVRGSFQVTIEINEPKSKNSITQYSINFD